MAETAAAREVRVVRDFAAPPERVFRAWTEPDQVAAWFGPAHVETPRDGVRIDLRVGGRYELTMLAPGGREFAIGYEITALEPPRLLELRSDPMPAAGMHEPTVVRITLEPRGGGTRMTLTDGPQPVGSRAGDGWEAAAAKLAALVDG
jgi:uncharacterized protein YndB with AHSA1/START domain